MDKRLYRMRLLFWKLKNPESSRDVLHNAMATYRDVLFDWNDSLNRTLALCEMYFGQDARHQLEGSVYEMFASIGRELEGAFRTRVNGGTVDGLKDVGKRISVLGTSVYVLNVRLIGLIQSEHVGSLRPDHEAPRPLRVCTPDELVGNGA